MRRSRKKQENRALVVLWFESRSGRLYKMITKILITLFLTFLFVTVSVLSFDDIFNNVISNPESEGLIFPDGMNNVIVYFKDDSVNLNSLNSQKVTGSSVTKSKQFVSLNNDEIKLNHVFKSLNGFTAEISNDTLNDLLSNPNVEVYYDLPVYEALNESVGIINADELWNYTYNGINLTGIGESICVIDSGINYSHPMFGSCTEKEFLEGNCNKVPGGWDFINNDSNPMDDRGHGTKVSSVIASADDNYKGVAPDAKIIAVKSLDALGSGSDSSVIKGIDWCIDNAERFNISVISMSLASVIYYSDYCDNHFLEGGYTRPVNEAAAKNISVVAAAGNEGLGRLPAPACNSNVIAVGATDKNDNLADLDWWATNRNNLTDLLAPGVNIKIPYDKTELTITHGTSIATPHVSGSLVLLRQFLRMNRENNINSSLLLNSLKETGVDVHENTCISFSGICLNNEYVCLNSTPTSNIINDCHNFTFKRIDVKAALISLDKYPPIINISSPLNDEFLEGNEIMSTSVSDFGAGVSSVYLSIFQEDDLVNYSKMNLDTGNSQKGNWTTDFNTSMFPNSNYNISINATDNKNITAFSDNINITINNNPPDVEIISLLNNSTLKEVILIIASANDSGSGVKSVFFTFYNSANNVTEPTLMNLFEGNPKIGYWNATLDTEIFPDGVYNISINATDKQNKSTLSEIVTITIDNPPNAAFISPLSNSVLEKVVVINASINESNSGVKNVSFTVYNSTDNVTNTTLMNLSSGNSSFGFWNATFNSSSFPDGVYNISINATDKQNTSGITNNTVIIDKNPPTTSVVAPSNDSTLKGSIVINTSANDSGSGVKNVSFKIYDTDYNIVNNGSMDLGSGNSSFGFWNVTLDTTSFSNGIYKISVSALDELYNMTFADNITINIRNHIPSGDDDDDDDDSSGRRNRQIRNRETKTQIAKPSEDAKDNTDAENPVVAEEKSNTEKENKTLIINENTIEEVTPSAQNGTLLITLIIIFLLAGIIILTITFYRRK